MTFFYYVLIGCIIKGVVKGLFYTEKTVTPSKNLVDFLIPGFYDR